MNMLFLADVNCFLSKSSKMVQKSSNLPWDYSKSLDYMMMQIDLMIDQFVFIRNEIEKDVSQICLDDIWPHICNGLFPFFKSAGEIVLQNEYQGIKLKDKKGPEERARRGRSEPLTTTEEMKKVVNFGT